MFVLFRNLAGLENAKEIITRQNPIDGFDTNLWLETRAIPENIIGCLAERPKDTDKQALQETVKLDEVDIQIVDRLSRDGRMPFGKIAKEIGVTTDTVIRRYERLKGNNYIKPIIQINPEKLGYQGFLVIFIELSVKGYIKEMVENLSKISGLHDIIRLSGRFDLQVLVHVKDCYDIMAIDKAIGKIPYVKRVESALAEVFPVWPPSRTTVTTF